MIEYNNNIIKDPKIKRIISQSPDSKQITILDQRFYSRYKKYYPSVSTILNYFPKNQYFYSWLKDTGHNSDIIMKQAAFEGTQVHNAIENYLDNKEIKWIDDNGVVLYSLDVWKMILKFTNFWEMNKPQLISSEYHLFSDKYEYAGTADLIVKMNDELWLLDIKTSNSIHSSYNLQLASYATAWNETHNEPITKCGILWLKAATRKEAKEGSFSGKGWQLKEVDDIERNFEMFLKIKDIYHLENPDAKPATETLPTFVKIETNS
jgi:hypothetical protein